MSVVPVFRCRLLVLLPFAAVISCGPPSLALTQDRLVQSGGELGLVGDFHEHGGVIVIVDGVPAHSAVLDGHGLRVHVPPLPRTGSVDVELVFADGLHMQLPGALMVSAPSFEVRDLAD